MLLRNIAVSGLLLVLFGGIVLSLASVARLRGFTPEIYVFSQPPEVIKQLTDEHVAACIDAFSDGVCSHLDYLRHVDGDLYELTTHVSAARALRGVFGEMRIVVSKAGTVLRDNQFCLPSPDTKERLFYYISENGAVIPDAPLKALDQANQKLFRQKLGFQANDWTCMEYIAAPDWLTEDGLLRRGFNDGVLEGVARRVKLVPASQQIILSTR